MIGYLLTQRVGHATGAPVTIAVCTKITLRKHIKYALRLLGRSRVRGLYHIKKVWIDL